MPSSDETKLPDVDFRVDDVGMYSTSSETSFYFAKLKCPQYPDGTRVTDRATIRQRVLARVTDGEDVMCLDPYALAGFVGLPDEFWDIEDEDEEQAGPLAEGIADACEELFVDETVQDVAFVTINGRPFVVSGGPEKTPVLQFLDKLDTFGMFDRDFQRPAQPEGEVAS